MPENVIVVKALISALILMSKNQFPQQFSKGLLFFCEVVVPHTHKQTHMLLFTVEEYMVRISCFISRTFSWKKILRDPDR
jgi:hypothetical protein